MVLAFAFLPSTKKEWIWTLVGVIFMDTIIFLLIWTGNVKYVIYANNAIYWFWIAFWIFFSLCVVYWAIKWAVNKFRH